MSIRKLPADGALTLRRASAGIFIRRRAPNGIRRSPLRRPTTRQVRSPFWSRSGSISSAMA
jgi:hypothetical protein